MKNIKVLLVEDNVADAELTRESFNQSKFKIDLDIVVNGVEALDYLNQRKEFKNAPHPDMILLDLNIPLIHGQDVLRDIKKNDDLKQIPVVVFSSSETEDDIIKSYKLGASCYVTKPVDFKAFQYIVNSLENFWFTVVKLPPSELI